MSVLLLLPTEDCVMPIAGIYNGLSDLAGAISGVPSE